MILVTVGTNEARFDRLLQAIDGLEPAEPVVVQHGPSPIRPRGSECVDYLPFEELLESIRAASTVITHAGVGSIATALAAGKRPIVVPRLQRFNEAVDDHQLWFGRRVAAAGMVTLVENPAELGEAVAADQGRAPPELRPDPRLVHDLRAYLDDVLGERIRRA